MAEREALVRVTYSSNLGELRREWDEYVRSAQNQTIRVTATMPNAGSRVGTTATFGSSGVAPEGGAPIGSSPAAMSPTPGHAAVNAAVVRTMGGTGFSAPTMPVNTAGTNSVYGDAGGVVGTGQFFPISSSGGGSRPSAQSMSVRYLRYAARATTAGVQPMDALEYFADGGESANAELAQWAYQRAQNRVGEAMVSGTSTPLPSSRGQGGAPRGGSGPSGIALLTRGLRSLGSLSGIAALADAGFAAANNYNLAMAQSSGDPYDMARSRIENDPAIAAGRMIPFIGGYGSNIHEYFTNDIADSYRTLRSASMGDTLSRTGFARMQDIASGSRSLAVVRAGAAGADAQSIVSAGNRIAEADAQLARTKDADATAKTRDDAAANDAIDAARAKFGSYSFDWTKRSEAAVGMTDAAGNHYMTPFATAKRDGDGRLVADQGNGFTLVMDDAVKGYNQAVGDKADIDKRYENNAADAARIADLAKQGATAELTNMAQGFRDAAKVLAGQTAGNINASNLSIGAADLARGGFSGQAIDQRHAATQAALDAKYWPDIIQKDQEIDRLKKMQPAANETPQATQARADLIAKTQAERDALDADRKGATAAATSEYEDQKREYTQNIIRMEGNTRAINLGASFQPLQATIQGINAEFDAASNGMADGSDDKNRLIARRDAQIRAAKAQYDESSLSIGIGLATDRASTAALMDRDVIGANAIQIGGSAIADATNLFASGRGALARERLQNGKDSLALAGRQYADSFRAEWVDPFQTVFNNPRDAEDPQRGFDDLNREAGKLDKLMNASDGDFLGTAASTSGADKLTGMAQDVADLKQIVADALAGA